MQTQSVDLAYLVAPWLDLSQSPYAQRTVGDLHLDSRQVRPGDCFVAIQGHSMDGRDYIPQALAAGAKLVLAQASSQEEHGRCEQHQQALVVYIDGLQHCLSELSGRFYRHMSTQLIGITGTNGKTTISQLIAQWLTLIGKKTAVMGTTGNGFLDQLQPAINTTGSAIEIQKTLAELDAQGAEYTALEISSHGLVQGRVKALEFAAGVFTNLSRDHLDYHGTMQEYAAAKLQLFTEHDCRCAVINIDDAVGKAWAAQLSDAIPVSLSCTEANQQGVYATQVDYATSGIKINFSGQFGNGQLSVPLIGEFNASNVLLAFTTLLSLGIDIDTLIETAPHLTPVLGRMELFSHPQHAKFVVDYAHTPDALEKALAALRVHCQGKLWVVVGCGGDRDKGKRPMMAAAAERLADHVILADDNPRSEDPHLIIEDMRAGLRAPQSVVVEHDRFQAAQYAFEHATAQDIVLLAGKGHEDYQVFAHGQVHYSDRETAAQLLGVTL
ncbi:UDP-N-acetylmuramoyl-L-alanyl-D-glutamate--2,6-diaminopimelate ligase [Vibrio sp. WXL103]|uniref:UDP-N-acetylmuramoyl-L-alanyl-D-glutamate--2, 6-diaminopimelate ligase n=1 Tax=unclassified Vibrio TaxID=2614977 RepID=UPI003EC78547